MLKRVTMNKGMLCAQLARCTTKRLAAVSLATLAEGEQWPYLLQIVMGGLGGHGVKEVLMAGITWGETKKSSGRKCLISSMFLSLIQCSSKKKRQVKGNPSGRQLEHVSPKTVAWMITAILVREVWSFQTAVVLNFFLFGVEGGVS